MSFVTTPILSSSPRARQSAATRELLPEPTGPPIPILRARSGCKEPPLSDRVLEGTELERGRETARQQSEILTGGAGVGGEPTDLRAGLDEPSRRECAVDGKKSDRGGGDGRGLLVEVGMRRRAIVEAGRGGNDPERHGSGRRAGSR